MLILLLIGAYLLGNVLTGSIMGYVFGKADIHTIGSGNPGARNVGRLYGKKAFILTFLGDALKGATAVFAAKSLGFGPAIELIALFLVLLGHVYPLLFKFRGGKGVSTFIGGLLLINPLVFTVFVALFIVFYAILKSFTIAGLGAILLFPIILLISSYNLSSIMIACFISGLILLAHHENIKEKLVRRKEPGQ